jgi:NodT family efflux transporter outer membrane factor (OMF) lipoprotein
VTDYPAPIFTAAKMSISKPVYPVLALLLAACASPGESATTGEADRQELSKTTEIAASSGPVASWNDVIAEGATEIGWLKTFDDSELEKIVAEVLRNNHRLAAAIARLETAGQFASQVGPALARAVTADGGAKSTGRTEASTNTPGVALNIQWELDLWARLGSAAAAAEGDFRASRTELEAARLSLVAQTAKAWLLAAEANLQLALSRETVEIYAEILKILEARVEAGAASPRDIYLAKADLAAAKERQRQAIGALIQALRSIEVILGRYPSAELEVVREFVPVPPPIPVGIPADLLERRPDLNAAERRVAAAFQRIESARAAKLPSLSLTAAGGSSSNELIDLIGAGSNFFSLGANFVAPLDIGGGLEAQVQIETAQQEAALANYGATALRAFAEVENGLTNEALLKEREDFLAAAVDDNTDALSAAKIQHDVGATDFLSVLQMQARELNSRISLVRIRNARLAQRVDLHLALGGDFRE